MTGKTGGNDEEMIDVEGYEDEDSMLRSIVNSQNDRPFAEALSQSRSSTQDNDDSLAEPPSEPFDSILLQDLQHSDSDDSDDDDFPFGDDEDEEEEEEEVQDLFNFPSPAPDNADESMEAMETNDDDQDKDSNSDDADADDDCT